MYFLGAIRAKREHQMPGSEHIEDGRTTEEDKLDPKLNKMIIESIRNDIMGSMAVR
jgi:hypothetical protein